MEIPTAEVEEGYADETQSQWASTDAAPSSLQENIRIYLRVRPPLAADGTRGASGLQLQGDRPVVFWTGTAGTGREAFEYDFVGGPETGQESVFEAVGRPITENCLQGYNGTIFAYGQTGSGKTFTMQGTEGRAAGLIPRALGHLFSRIAEDTEWSYTCSCSYVEIYNETIFDLLDASGSKVCSLRGFDLEDCRIVPIGSPLEALEVFSAGALGRHVASTGMNRESSRSHAIFTLYIGSRSLDNASGVERKRCSRFNLVDLAGSERQQLTGALGARLKEAGSINKSLLALSNVINALVETAGGRPRHVHYRDSKLTQLLRDSLGGNARTCIVACVSPAGYGETLSTLRFAQRAKMIKNRAVVNQAVQGDLLQLQAELARLQSELLSARSGPSSAEDGAMLRIAMQRQTELSSELMASRERLEALEELCRRQDYTLQSERLLRRLALSNTQSEELQQILESMREHHPETIRLAMENARLRERLDRIDGPGTGDLDGQHAQIQRQQEHIDALTRRLLKEELVVEHADKKSSKEEEAVLEHADKRRRVSMDLEHEGLLGELASLKEQLAQNQREKEGLVQEIDRLKGESARIDSQAREEQERLTAQLARLQENYTNTMAQKESSIASISTALQSSMAEVEQLRSALGDAQRSLAHSTTLKQELESRLEATQQQALSEASEAAIRLAHLASLHAAQSQAAAAMAQSQQEEAARAASAESARLNEQVRRMEASMSEIQGHLSNLSAELEQQRALNAKLSQELSETKARLEQVPAVDEEEAQMLRLELARLRRSFADKEEQFKALQSASVDGTRHKLVLAENAQLSQKLSKLESLLQQQSQEAAAASQTLSQLQAAHARLQVERQALLDDNAKLVQHHNAKQKLHYHVKIKEENNKLRADVQALQAQLAKLIDKGSGSASAIVTPATSPTVADKVAEEEYDCSVDLTDA